MPTVAGYGQDGFKKIIIASALAHGALILFGLYVYKGEVKEFISPVYTVSLVAPSQFSSSEPAVRQSAEKTTYAPLASKAAPKAVAMPKTAPAKPDGFALKNSGDKTLIENKISSFKEKIKDEEDNAALEKRIDALKKKNSLTASAKPGANKQTTRASISSAPQTQQTHASKPAAQGAPHRSLQASGTNSTTGTIENKHNAYYSYIGKRVHDEWDYPVEFEKSNIEVIVSVKIGRDGNVLANSVKIEKSSGNRAFDESLLAAVKKAGQFAPLPKDFQDDFLEADFGFCPSCAEQKVTIKKSLK